MTPKPTYTRPLDLKQGRVDLSHGSGGRAMAQLIQSLFARELDNEYLAQGDDGARLPFPLHPFPLSYQGRGEVAINKLGRGKHRHERGMTRPSTSEAALPTLRTNGDDRTATDTQTTSSVRPERSEAKSKDE